MSDVLLIAARAKEPATVSVERTGQPSRDTFHVIVGGRATDLELIEFNENGGVMRMNGRIIPFHVLRKGSSLQVWLGGRVHAFDVIDRTAKRTTDGAAAAAVQTALKAPMPGTILKINISSGDAFEAHQPLIVMESMKMEMTLSAPHGGRVKEILCRPGQLVEMSALLARFEDAGP